MGGVIYADTRQKAGKHDKKHRQIEELGFALVRQKLDIGDYMLDGHEDITVDTKADLGEVYSNLVCDTGRFMREVRRAHQNGVKLVVLIEQGNYHTLEDVKRYKPKYGRITGRELSEKMIRIHIAYGVEFLFCDKRVTGKKIIEILGGGANEQCSGGDTEQSNNV